MSFKNLKLVWKIVSIIFTLGIISLVGTYYASSRLFVIDELYSRIISNQSAASVKFARATRAIAQYSGSIYEALASNDQNDFEQAVTANKEAVEFFETNISESKLLLPWYVNSIETVESRFAKARVGSCGEAIRIAQSFTSQELRSKAVALQNDSCNPELNEIIDDFATLNTGLLKEISTESADAKAVATNTFWLAMTSIGLGIALVIGVAFIVVKRGIVRPIKSAVQTMALLGQGDLSVQLSGSARSDEVGDIEKSLETLRDQLLEADNARHEASAAEAKDREAVAKREKLAEEFVDQMKTLVEGFARSSTEVAEAAKGLSSTAEETSRQAQAVAAAAEEAATNVQTVASSSEEMTASISEINQQVNHSTTIADAAFSEAENSNSRIGQLNSAASAIGAVIDLIKGIADKTNLLALNATIEAARAGEAGKGFAVVAAEVKQLADQTSRATGEIGTKIGEIQHATNGAVNSMSEISRIIGNIKETATSIAGAVEQQGAATGEIARNCQQAALGTQHVTENIAEVGRAAELTGVASTQLMGLSDGLARQAKDLKQTVEVFIRGFAAA